jgi:hypothetical protein
MIQRQRGLSEKHKPWVDAVQLAHPISHLPVQNLPSALTPGPQRDFEGHRAPPAQPIILMEVDWLASNMRHVERSQHARDGEPYLALGDKHSRAYPPPGTKYPVISRVRVAQLGADGGAEGIIDIVIGL